MTRTVGALSKATAEKLELAEKEIIVPLILQVFANPLNKRIPFKLSVIRDNRKKYSVGARDRFNEFFTITRHGRNPNTGETWPTKVSMNLVQLFKAQELLRAHGYTLDNIHINTDVMGKPLIEWEIDDFEIQRIERGLS